MHSNINMNNYKDQFPIEDYPLAHDQLNKLGKSWQARIPATKWN